MFTYIDSKLTFPGANAYTADKRSSLAIADELEKARREAHGQPPLAATMDYDEQSDASYWHHAVSATLDKEDKDLFE